MTLRHNYSSSFSFLVLITTLFTSGCATTSHHQFGLAFLPPAPKSSSDPLADAPKVESNVYLAQSRTFVGDAPAAPLKPTAIDLRIRRAEDHFAAGKRMYEANDAAAARKEFDTAVDLLLSAPENAPDRLKAEKKLEEFTAAIFRYDMNGLGLADLAGQPSYDKAPLEDILQMTFPVDPSLTPVVAQQLKGTVSQLPLQMNDAVLSYIHYFQGDKGRKTLISGLKRAGRYRNLISKTLAEEGVPQELIYLAQAESGFLPRAISNKSATGMWQFMQSRGREYGLMQSASFDDRLDPEKATRSAARHLKDLYNKFGDWYLAIAGYNCGDGCVERAVQRTGYADFWELRSRNAIPRETTNYVPIILAMTIMAKNPSAYGLDQIDADPALDYETVKLDSPTHLALVADLVDRPVSEIRDLNPALLKTVTPAGYELKIPRSTGTALTTGLNSIPETRRLSWRVHRVTSGDTIESIARRYKTSVDAVSAVNHGNEAASIGDILIIPAAAEVVRAAKVKGSGRLTARSKAGASKRGTSQSARATTAHGRKSSSTSSFATRGSHRKGLLQRASLR